MRIETTAAAFAAYEAVRDRLPGVTRKGACKRSATLEDIAGDYDVFLLDAFGVLNIGETAIPGVPDRVAALQAAGKRVIVVSNAGGYPHRALMQKYTRLGYDFDADDVISSRKALLSAVAQGPARLWGVIAVKAYGRGDLDDLAVRYLGDARADYDAVDAVMMLGSWDWTNQRHRLLVDSLKAQPRPFLIGNPDLVAPHESGFTTEPGAYAHAFADTTGQVPDFYGKPFANIYDLAFARLPADQDRSRVLMVGDSLHTDVLGGQVAGVDTALIEGFGFFAGADVDAAIATSGIAPDHILARP